MPAYDVIVNVALRAGKTPKDAGLRGRDQLGAYQRVVEAPNRVAAEIRILNEIHALASFDFLKATTMEVRAAPAKT